MRSSIIAVLLLPFIVTALSWGPYDLGLYGISPTHKFVSTSFLSPLVKILEWDPRCDDDGAVVLISPRGLAVTDPGPVMLDARGDMIWTEKRFGQITNLQVQHFDGQDYLTFWAGISKGPHSNGTYYLVDSSYEVAYTVSAVGPGRGGDLHEFKITKNGTALFTIYEDVEIDCSDLGIGSCWVDDCLFQEVDIKTGNLVFEWRASDHVRLGDSFKPRGKDGETKATAYDYFHINSVDKDDQGNYLISARHMHTVYYISPSGDIIWSLGGRNNNFTDLSAGKATDFSWQHHANWQPNNTMTLFDNGGNNVFHSRAEFSRGMRLSLDIPNMTVTLLQTYVHPDRILAISQGSIQVVPDSDNVFIGWGNSPTYTEFSSTGDVLCSIRFGASLFFEILDLGWVKSYRGFKGRWIGRPKTLPDINTKDGHAFVSWNGATEVKTWRLQSVESRSSNDEDFEDVQDSPRTGFETIFALDTVVNPCIRIAALDAAGKVLGYTKVIDKPTVKSVWFQVTIFAFCFVAAGVLFKRYQALLSKYSSRALAYVQRKKRGQMYELISSHE